MKPKLQGLPVALIVWLAMFLVVLPVDAKEKHKYEVMWAADAVFCKKVCSYANQKRTAHAHVPIEIVFGNVQWTTLDDPTRQAVNVTFAGELKPRTIFRWVVPRRMDLEWDYFFDIFPGLIDFTTLRKDPVSFAGKQEWTLEPDDVVLKGLCNNKSSAKSNWCSKLKNKVQNLNFRENNPIWRFSFFDLIAIDGKAYITAATEKYQSPDDMHLPIVILVARYTSPPDGIEPPVHGSEGAMAYLEHRCYLMKTY